MSILERHKKADESKLIDVEGDVVNKFRWEWMEQFVELFYSLASHTILETKVLCQSSSGMQNSLDTILETKIIWQSS